MYLVLAHFWSNFTAHARKTTSGYNGIFFKLIEHLGLTLNLGLTLKLDVELIVTFTKLPKSSNELNFELR